jgi:hypothetical protein
MVRLVSAGALAMALVAVGCGIDGTGTSGGPASTKPSAAPPSEPASSGGASSGGAAGGAASASCTQGAGYSGAPITAADGAWTWVPVPGAICRDGSATGVGVRLHEGSTKVALYFEGGGACFHDASCAINDVLASFGEPQFTAWAGAAGSGGIFDSGAADNPLRDYNFVYVPYCTGDVHAGDREHVDVPGDLAPKDQAFVGYRNVGLYLERLVPTFAGATSVVVTGISAGGFGAAFNYDRVAQAFCAANVALVDDSGPPMSDDYLAPCLQKRWRELWNLDATLPADCAACRGANGGGIVHYVDYLAKKYPKAELGLVSSSQDAVISLFYGFGENGCAGLDGPSAPMSGAKFQAGLEDLATHHAAGTNLGMFVIPSVSHTWLTSPALYVTESDGKPLTGWLDALVNHHAVSVVGL